MSNNIIAIAAIGPAGSGKSSFCKALAAHINATQPAIITRRMSFAFTLKAAINAFEKRVGIRMTDWMDYDAKAAARPLMVEAGRYARGKNKNVFADALVNTALALSEVYHDAPILVFIDDLRYVNELTTLQTKLACVVPVRLTREGFLPANDEEANSIADLDAYIEEDTTVLQVPEWKSPDELAARVESVGKLVVAYHNARVRK